MVSRMYRSKGLKRAKIKTPGGKITVHYRKERPKTAKCSSCGKELKGVPRLRQSELKRLPKSQRRPERPYGGILCSECMREVFRKRAKKTSIN